MVLFGLVMLSRKAVMLTKSRLENCASVDRFSDIEKGSGFAEGVLGDMKESISVEKESFMFADRPYPPS